MVTRCDGDAVGLQTAAIGPWSARTGHASKATGVPISQVVGLVPAQPRRHVQPPQADRDLPTIVNLCDCHSEVEGVRLRGNSLV